MSKRIAVFAGLLLIIGLGFLGFQYLTRKQQVTTTPETQTSTNQVKIFLVALDDQGESGKKIGCGDSLVAVERAIPDTTTPLRAALEELLSISDQYYGQSGLYNSLYQSQLKVESVSLENGKAIISLSGEYKLGGVCDNPRFQTQIEETASQFPSVSEVSVFINGVALETIVSGKGE